MGAVMAMIARWETNDEGEREYVFEEQNGKRRTGRVPYRIAIQRIPFGYYQDTTPEEWAIAKWAADKSVFEDRMKVLTTGPDRGSTVEALMNYIRENGLDPADAFKPK